MSTPAQQTPEIPGGITVDRNVPIPLPAKSLEVWGLEISPRNGEVVVAIVEGEFTVKKLWMRAGRLKLMAANPTFPDIVPKDWGLHAGQREEIFANTAVNEIWGVGTRIGAKLIAGGVTTVLDLLRMDAATARGGWSVVLERTVLELQGTPCIGGFENSPPAKQEIACTRSFGRPVTELETLIEAVSEFASRAAVKLRRQHSHAGAVLCFVRTSPFRPDAQYSRSMVTPLLHPTADTTLIAQAAIQGLQRIYKPGFNYPKAGVMLLELQPDRFVDTLRRIAPEQSLHPLPFSLPTCVTPLKSGLITSSTSATTM